VSDRILVVDDEPAIVDAVTYALRASGFEVDTFGDGESALDAARSTDGYDVLVLDVRLPGLSGIEICRRLRSESDVPILILTAMDAEVDRVLGLEAGADDYVTKPFSVAELVSRVRAILRRRELDRASGGAIRRVGSLELDVNRHEVRIDGKTIRLTPSEFRLLAFLAQEPERVYTRREIMQHLWDSTYVGDQRACDIHVSNLRRKIEETPGRPRRLVTVRGVGYKLLAV
jgi:two-component system, OmpR family, response regulator RegX3